MADYTVEVDGLNETLKGLAKADRVVANEVRKILRENAKTVALAARKKKPHPISPGRRTFIQWRANNRGASVVLSGKANDRAMYEEFGGELLHVGFDDNVPRYQSQMRRRATRPHNPDGYVIQPTIRKMMPEFIDNLAEDIAALYDRLVERG